MLLFESLARKLLQSNTLKAKTLSTLIQKSIFSESEFRQREIHLNAYHAPLFSQLTEHLVLIEMISHQINLFYITKYSSTNHFQLYWSGFQSIACTQKPLIHSRCQTCYIIGSKSHPFNILLDAFLSSI